MLNIGKEPKKEERETIKRLDCKQAGQSAAGAVAPMAKPAMTAVKAGKKGKTVDDITQLNQDKVIDEVSEIESASKQKNLLMFLKMKDCRRLTNFLKQNVKGELYPLKKAAQELFEGKPIPKARKWIKAEDPIPNYTQNRF